MKGWGWRQRLRHRVLPGLLLIVLAVWVGGAVLAWAETTEIDLDVQSFTLENGMLFLVVERHTTPQVACRVAIRAGAALEERGRTGMAHMLEHMMFKGTKNYGTMDLERDRELQSRIESAYQTVLAEQKKRDPNEALIREKLDEMNRLRKEVQEIYVPQAFSSQLSRNGAVGVNAFTSKDQTQYVMSLPSDMLEQWFSMVSEQLFEPVFREFYVEKEVVQREWAYRYVNNPMGAAWLDLDATAYTAHPYRNPTIGWKSDMERYNTTAAQEFHRRYYNPRNAVAVLVGDVTVDQVRRFAETYFARYPAGDRSPETVTREPAQGGPRRSVRFLEGARTPLVLLGHHGARMGTDDFYALDVLNMVLSQGQGARMTQHITRKGRAVSAWSHNPDNRYAGMVVLGGAPNEPEGLEEGASEGKKRQAYLEACQDLERMLVDEVERLQEEPVTERELKRIKKLAHYDFLTRLRSNESLAGTLATLEVQEGWEYLKDYLDRIGRVTAEDVARVARTYIGEKNRTTCFVIPGGRPDHPPEPYEEVRSFSASSAPKVKRPENLSNHSVYPTPEGWKHPLSFERKPEKIVYPDAETVQVKGAPLFYLPDRELPLIDLILLVRAGQVDVPEEKIGLARLLNASLVAGGTRAYSPSELAALLDEHAIQLDVSVSEEVTAVKLSVMREDWETALEVLEEVLARPRFDTDVLEASRNRLLIGLERQSGDAGTVSRREAEIWHFQGHPYGRDPLDGLKTIPDLTRDDLRDFLGRYVVPSNMVAAVSGDLSLEEAEAGLSRLLTTLGDGRAPERSLEDPAPSPPVLAFIHKPGQVQSQVTMALPGPRRSDPAYWKTNLLVDVFGGQDSLIYRRLRDDLGLVYAAYFYQTYKWQAGWILGFLGCKGDQTARAVKETARLMQSLQEEVPSGELEQKRLDALNSFVFNVDTPAALTSVYARYRMRGEPLDTLERIQEAFMKAEQKELPALARKYLDPGRLQVFVVGDGTVPVVQEDGSRVTLEEALQAAAEDMGLPFVTLPLQ
jgi:predicted Zn-dependent peptidase